MEASPLARQSLTSLLKSPDRQALVAEARRVAHAGAPASDTELGRIIFQLLIMYAEFDRRPEASKTMVLAQWRQCLSGWPAVVLSEAARRWIGGEKAAFMPQPGDILRLCDREGAFRRALADKARGFLEMTGNPLPARPSQRP